MVKGEMGKGIGLNFDFLIFFFFLQQKDNIENCSKVTTRRKETFNKSNASYNHTYLVDN